MKVLVTATNHPSYNKIGTITHRAKLNGREVWVIEMPNGGRDYVYEGQFRVIKRQEDG